MFTQHLGKRICTIRFVQARVFLTPPLMERMLSTQVFYRAITDTQYLLLVCDHEPGFHQRSLIEAELWLPGWPDIEY